MRLPAASNLLACVALLGCVLSTACSASSSGSDVDQTEGALGSADSTWKTGEECGYPPLPAPRDGDTTYYPRDYYYAPDCSGTAHLPVHTRGTICATGTFWCFALSPGPVGVHCECEYDPGQIEGVLN